MEEIWMERWQLAVCRIREIAEDPETAGKPGDYFKKTAGFVLLVLEALKKAEADEFSHASLQELQDFYRRLYGDITGDAYARSYADPAYAAAELGDGYGQILSFVYTELRGLIVCAFEGRREEILIYMELFLQIHSEYEGDVLPAA